MLTETFRSIITTARNVFRNWQSMLLMAAVYASLLALLYFFVSIKEATLAQVTLTFAFAIAVPLLFFILQAMIASGGRRLAGEAGDETDEMTAGLVLRRSLTSFWKLILISLPLIALGILIAYLLARAQNHFGQTLNESAGNTLHPMSTTGNAPPARPINWKVALFSTIRYLAFGLILPLAAIHLWLATVRDGLGGAFRKIATLLARAFAPQSVLTYIVGFIVFAVVPYFLLFKTTQSQRAWLELSFLVARLVVVFLLTLFGWTITVRALGRFSQSPAPKPANETA